ncbi:hypothetical protein LTR94_035231, partial [Friedmanniomyces endolithicus]
ARRSRPGPRTGVPHQRIDVLRRQGCDRGDRPRPGRHGRPAILARAERMGTGQPRRPAPEPARSGAGAGPGAPLAGRRLAGAEHRHGAQRPARDPERRTGHDRGRLRFHRRQPRLR